MLYGLSKQGTNTEEGRLTGGATEGELKAEKKGTSAKEKDGPKRAIEAGGGRRAKRIKKIDIHGSKGAFEEKEGRVEDKEKDKE